MMISQLKELRDLQHLVTRHDKTMSVLLFKGAGEKPGDDREILAFVVSWQDYRVFVSI